MGYSSAVEHDGLLPAGGAFSTRESIPYGRRGSISSACSTDIECTGYIQASA